MKKPLNPKAKPRHTFYLVTKGIDGEASVLKSRAVVKEAKGAVTITLTREHVENARRMNGVGNSQACAMAFCAVAHKAAFSHKVYAWLDWTSNRLYIASKLDENNWPCECVRYEHRDDIAKYNDTKDGLKWLAKDIEVRGPRVVKLRPVRDEPPFRPGRKRGKDNGSRARPLIGASARFAFSKTGGDPALIERLKRRIKKGKATVLEESQESRHSPDDADPPPE